MIYNIMIVSEPQVYVYEIQPDIGQGRGRGYGEMQHFVINGERGQIIENMYGVLYRQPQREIYCTENVIYTAKCICIDIINIQEIPASMVYYKTIIQAIYNNPYIKLKLNYGSFPYKFANCVLLVIWHTFKLKSNYSHISVNKFGVVEVADTFNVHSVSQL